MNNNNIYQKGWLKEYEYPFFKNLKYSKAKHHPLLNENNKNTRDIVLSEIINGLAKPVKLNDCLENNNSNQDLLISEVDRFGLPLRTVLNKNTGLIRSDPYYSNDWLHKFYSEYYRDLYSNENNISKDKMLDEQINRGSSYYDFIKGYLNPEDKILEIGCGMGGILSAFAKQKYVCKGIDLGLDFINYGRKKLENIQIEKAEIDDELLKGNKYDLVILSHLIEHIVEIDDFLSKVHKLLTKEGKLFISVPGVYDIHNTYQSNIQLYLQNAHCWNFSLYTLTKVLNKNKFNLLKADEKIYCLSQKNESIIVNQSDKIEELKKIVNYLRIIKNKRRIEILKSTIKKIRHVFKKQ